MGNRRTRCVSRARLSHGRCPERHDTKPRTDWDSAVSTEFLRTRVDEVRRTRTGNHTSSTYNGRQTECTSIDAYFLCPYGPLPLTQTRQEHLHRARRTRKGLFCIYFGGVRRHVGGFQPHEPTQVHERMTRKCEIWPYLTPLHTAHTHTSQRISLTEQHSNTVVLHRQHRAHQTKTHQKRRLQTFRQCSGASITNVVAKEGYLGDGFVRLVKFSQGTNTGKHLAARMLRRTITQLRSP